MGISLSANSYDRWWPYTEGDAESDVVQLAGVIEEMQEEISDLREQIRQLKENHDA